MKKARGKSSESKRPRASRARFLPISEEMKEWSAMLALELRSLPDITLKSMFGFSSFYRKGRIFAALPQTRGFRSASSLIVKFDPIPPALLKRAKSDPRMDTNTRLPGKGWFTFELNSYVDVRDALWWLNRAYAEAK